MLLPTLSNYFHSFSLGLPWHIDSVENLATKPAPWWLSRNRSHRKRHKSITACDGFTCPQQHDGTLHYHLPKNLCLLILMSVRAKLRISPELTHSDSWYMNAQPRGTGSLPHQLLQGKRHSKDTASTATAVEKPEFTPTVRNGFHEGVSDKFWSIIGMKTNSTPWQKLGSPL